MSTHIVSDKPPPRFGRLTRAIPSTSHNFFGKLDCVVRQLAILRHVNIESIDPLFGTQMLGSFHEVGFHGLADIRGIFHIH